VAEIMAMRNLTAALVAQKNAQKSAALQRYFKTGKGEYGEGDVFLGLTVPLTRKIAKEFIHLSLKELSVHIRSKFHEERLASLEILNIKFAKSDEHDRQKIVTFYIKNLRYVNNWDLVDGSAPYILGEYLLDKDKEILYSLAKSSNLWERRVATLSTFTFIRNNQFADALHIAESLLTDEHDLIHKAVGWMLREVGNRDRVVLEIFLEKYYRRIPRTMLRYAIEKFPERERKEWLKR